MKGWRLLRRMEAAGLIRFWKMYEDPIGPPDTPWGWSTKDSGRLRTIMVTHPEAEKRLASILA